jgi:hypothetical protein
MALRGRVVFVDEEVVWLARGSRLLCSRDGGRSWTVEMKLPLGIVGRGIAATRLGRRLARAGVHHFLPDPGVVVASGKLFYRADSGRLRVSSDLRGSRPLVVATDGELTCYGEYRGNLERAPVCIWASEDAGRSWHPVHEFTGVRHVHGVHYDSYSNAFWITTGDEDDESAIWVTRDRFRTVERVVGGNQQTRAVQLCFTSEFVYFGSDTPRAANHLYRLGRATGEVEQLQRVGSSVFYGTRLSGHLFFSTAAEPSSANRTDRSEIWHGRPDGSWRLLETLPTDIWPSRLFQYGQVQFPAGPGDGRHLYYSPQGTRGDGFTFIIPFNEL